MALGTVILTMIGLTIGVWYVLMIKVEQRSKRKKLLDRIEAEVRPKRGIKVSKPLTAEQKISVISSDVIDRKDTIRNFLDKNS